MSCPRIIIVVSNQSMTWYSFVSPWQDIMTSQWAGYGLIQNLEVDPEEETLMMSCISLPSVSSMQSVWHDMTSSRSPEPNPACASLRLDMTRHFSSLSQEVQCANSSSVELSASVGSRLKLGTHPTCLHYTYASPEPQPCLDNQSQLLA